MIKFQKQPIGLVLLLALSAALTGCQGKPPAGAARPDSTIPPYGPSRTIILPNGKTFTCRVAGGGICPQP